MTTQVGTSDFPVSVALGGGRRQEVRIGRHTTWTQFRQRVYAARLERERGRGARERGRVCDHKYYTLINV